MKKIFLILITITLFLQATSVFSQELEDVEILTMPLQDIRLTEFGVVVHYTKSTGTRGTLYLPSSWFQYPPKNPDDIKAKMIIDQVASRRFSLKITYFSAQPGILTLYIPNKYQNLAILPKYEQGVDGNLTLEELSQKFEAQKTSALIIE